MTVFSIVTPSFNQARFLEPCLQSVLAQEVPSLEYVVIDGGSTDGSADIIRRYAGRLAYWQSQPDGGHMDAVNTGFIHTAGDIMGWLNSDDMLTPWALRTVASIFEQLPQVEWLTTRFPLLMNEDGMVIAARTMEGYNARMFYRGRNVPLKPAFYKGYIQQESTFWRRSLWDRAGATVDRTLRVAGDFELWARFFQLAELHTVQVPLGCFRFQSASFTSNEMDTYLEVCRSVLRRYPYQPPSKIEMAIRRLARLLPVRMRPFTGLACPVSFVAQSERGSRWEIRREWIV
jgi:glycosyltransferase involved in cell wall biosynthesis